MEILVRYSPLLTTSILGVVIFLICFVILRRKLVNLPPGNFGLPGIGETIDFSKSFQKGSLERFVVERMGRYSSKIFKTSLMGEKMAVLCGPTGNKFVFSNEYKLMKTWFIRPMKKVLLTDMKPGSVQEDLQRWRKHFSEFLRPYALPNYVELMDSVVKHHMDSEWAPHSNIRVHPLARKLAFALACRVFMDVEDPALMDKLRGQFDIVSAGLGSIPIDLPGTQFRRSINTANLLRGEIQSIFRSNGKLLSNPPPISKSSGGLSHSSPKLFISYLLSATEREGKMLSESEIASMILVALVAGLEPASAMFTNLVYYLGHHPNVYAQALAEQMEIKSLKDGEELLTWEDTKRMTYSRQVINEVLRLAPPSMGGFREAAHDVSYEGFTIPKGWKVFWSINSTHKNPEYFPNPEKFDPSRFEGDGPAPYTFTPFGGGPRVCPGNEFSILAGLLFMHNLLVNFKWEDDLIGNEKTIRPPSSFPQGDALPIKLHRRSSAAI